MQNLIVPAVIAGGSLLLARYAGVLGMAFWIPAMLIFAASALATEKAASALATEKGDKK